MSSNIIIISSSNAAFHIHSNQNQNQFPKTQSLPPKNSSFNNSQSRIPTRYNPAGPHSAAQMSAQKQETLYELLGIGESASSLSDIKKAYRKMARLYHPDVSPPDRVEEYKRRFIMVHEAYETLSNPHTRALYDRDLAFGNGSKRHQEEKEEWRSSWETQLDELERRDCRERSTWGARMRNY